jgi:hypothetical protein
MGAREVTPVETRPHAARAHPARVGAARFTSDRGGCRLCKQARGGRRCRSQHLDDWTTGDMRGFMKAMAEGLSLLFSLV